MLGLLLLGAVVIGLIVAERREAHAQKDKTGQPVFEVFMDKSKEYRYRLVLGEERIAISSQGYKSKAEIMKVIEAVKKEAAKAKVVDVKK